jgi:hypothetical protein
MNGSILWPGILLIVVLALAVVGLRVVARWLRTQRSIPAEVREELAQLPMSPLQKRAWSALLLALAAVVACFAIIVGNGGAQVYWDVDAVRLPVTAIFITTLAAHSLILYLPLPTAASGYDERDRRILASAPVFQAAAILVVLAFWMIYLTETSRPERMISTVYLYLMFGSAIFAQMVATDLGILFGYWSGVGDAES